MELQATKRPDFNISDQLVGIKNGSDLLLKSIRCSVESRVDSKIEEILKTRGPLRTKLGPAYFGFDIRLIMAEEMLKSVVQGGVKLMTHHGVHIGNSIVF